MGLTPGAVRPRGRAESDPAILDLPGAVPPEPPTIPVGRGEVTTAWARPSDGSFIRVWAPVDRSRLRGAGLQRSAAAPGHEVVDPVAGAPVASSPLIPRACVEREDAEPRRSEVPGRGGGPIIRVTIARVEVEAEAPGTERGRSRARRRREPPLSLEEYLERRGEEGA
ncbi:MAG: hypothetical protein PVI57_14400 [Gemmatimonadota bacterium]